jgi:hypothetical protein
MERIHADYDAEEAVGLISQRSLLTPTRSSFNASHSPEDGTVRVFDRNLHLRVPLDPKHVRLKRTRV